MCNRSSRKVNARRQCSSGTSAKLNVFRLKLVAAWLMTSSYYGSTGKLSGTGPTLVVAFRASPPRMSSNMPDSNSRIKSQQVLLLLYV